MVLRTVKPTASILLLFCLSLGCEPPAEQPAARHTAQTSIPTTADAVQPLLVGARAPQVTLRDAEGEPVGLPALLAEKPTVLVFYRGGWCRYCNTQLGQLKQTEARVLESP